MLREQLADDLKSAMKSKDSCRDLAEREAAEIVIIEKYLPRQLDEDEITNAVHGVIEKLGSSCIKDMGRTMAALKAAYSGQMDFSKAGNMVKEYLTSAR